MSFSVNVAEVVIEIKNDEDKTEDRFLPGQLDLGPEFIDKGTGRRKKRNDWRSKLDDVAFLFDSPGVSKQGQVDDEADWLDRTDDGDDWPFGGV